MVVRMRSTKSKKNNRRSRQNVNIPLTKEENGLVRVMHKISRVDGSYKGKVYLDVFTKRSDKKVIKKESINKKNQTDVETKTQEEAKKIDNYSFEKNKDDVTKEHYDAIRKKGLSKTSPPSFRKI